jgi:hypothetical protein
MIREKGFNHPGDHSKEELSGYVWGNFQHEYELKTFNEDKVVIDHATGLMWQQSGSAKWMLRKDVKGYLDDLNRNHYCGYSDWRLPTVEELASLLEPTGENKGLYIDPIFDPQQEIGWTADWVNSSHAWAVSFLGGIIMEVWHGGVANPLYVRAVRSHQ